MFTAEDFGETISKIGQYLTWLWDLLFIRPLCVYLELPLSWHDLCIGAGDVDASVETGAIMRFQHITAKHPVSSHTAVVRTCQHQLPLGNIFI